ncbi:MAG: radical SAM protein [Candidatus Omnitrophica bacterium]|nr:radical SAM protein [Candidatus Omnitrophota bacterium]
MLLSEQERRKRYLLRLSGARDGKAYIGPAVLHLHITNRCNLACRYCWYHSPGNPMRLLPRQDMPLSKIARIVRDCIQLKVDALYLSGEGEPTLHPDFSKIMSLLKDAPMEVTLFTNGTFPLALVKYVVMADRVIINFAAPDQQTYAAVHGQDSFRRVVGNIGRLVRFREARNQAFRIEIVYVTNKRNRDLAGDMEKFAKTLGVDNFAPTVMQSTVYSSDLVTAYPESGRMVGRGRPCQACFNGWFYAAYTLNGQLSLCCQITEMDIANFKKHTFKSAWLSEAFNRMRMDGRSGRLIRRFEECRQCRAAERNRMTLRDMAAVKRYE